MRRRLLLVFWATAAAMGCDYDWVVPTARAPSQDAGDGGDAPAADASGDVAGGAIADACAPNLVFNSDFEVDLRGWEGVGGTVARVPGGRGGAGHSAEVCKVGSDDGFGLNDTPNTVRPVPVGSEYRLDAWVKSEAHSPSVRPFVTEDGPAGDVGIGTNDGVVAGQTWQRVSVAYAALAPDSTSLALRFTARNAPAGTCFQIDDICFVRTR